MSRWLQAAKAVSTPSDKTDKAAKIAPMSQAVTLQNEKAVLPQGPTPDGTCAAPIAATQSAEIIILAAIREGMKTPGAIATATRLGATTTYQDLDRMARGGGADHGAGWHLQPGAGHA